MINFNDPRERERYAREHRNYPALALSLVPWLPDGWTAHALEMGPNMRMSIHTARLAAHNDLSLWECQSFPTDRIFRDIWRLMRNELLCHLDSDVKLPPCVVMQHADACRQAANDHVDTLLARIQTLTGKEPRYGNYQMLASAIAQVLREYTA